MVPSGGVRGGKDSGFTASGAVLKTKRALLTRPIVFGSFLLRLVLFETDV